MPAEEADSELEARNNQRFALAEKTKEKGNDAHKRGDFAGAASTYDKVRWLFVRARCLCQVSGVVADRSGGQERQRKAHAISGNAQPMPLYTPPPSPSAFLTLSHPASLRPYFCAFACLGWGASRHTNCAASTGRRRSRRKRCSVSSSPASSLLPRTPRSPRPAASSKTHTHG